MTESEARRRRLGEAAHAHAEQVVAEAPPLSPETLHALRVLTRQQGSPATVARSR